MRAILVALQREGGIVHYSTALANALSELLPVRVVVPEGAEGGYLPSVEITSVPVPLSCRWCEIRRSPAYLRRFPSFLRTLDGGSDEVIHFLNRHEYLTVAAPRVQHRLVVTMHDPHPHLGEASPRKLLANWAYRRLARQFLVFGEALRQDLISLGVPAERVHVVPIGAYSCLVPGSLPPPDPQPTGLFFGRIAPYKGLQVLLEALPLIRRQVPGFRLIIAGSGDVRPYRALLDRELASGQTELCNRYISDEETGTLLGRAHVVLLPYLEATQSGVVSLAFGAERPVIASGVGAIPELVRHEETGLLVPPGDPVALAEQTVRLLRDRQLLARLAAAGREYEDRELSWQAVAARTLDVYARITDRRVRPPRRVVEAGKIERHGYQQHFHRRTDVQSEEGSRSRSHLPAAAGLS